MVGTEDGIIEHWSIEKEELINTYEAHPTSPQGISSIIEIKSSSDLLWQGAPLKGENTRMIATASHGCPEFRIWVMNAEPAAGWTLQNHLKIETSLPGISYLLESSETVIVAADPFKTLKFYDFVDR